MESVLTCAPFILARYPAVRASKDFRYIVCLAYRKLWFAKALPAGNEVATYGRARDLNGFGLASSYTRARAPYSCSCSWNMYTRLTTPLLHAQHLKSCIRSA